MIKRQEIKSGMCTWNFGYVVIPYLRIRRWRHEATGEETKWSEEQVKKWEKIDHPSNVNI